MARAWGIDQHAVSATWSPLGEAMQRQRRDHGTGDALTCEIFSQDASTLIGRVTTHEQAVIATSYL